MTPRDRLHVLELVRVLEEATTMLRHDVRNRLGSIRNMAYFVNKRLSKNEEAPREPRVMEFLSKIESEVQWTDDLIEQWFVALNRVHPLTLRALPVTDAVTLAVESVRVTAPAGLDVRCEDALVEVDLEDLALGLRCLLENAVEAGGDAVIGVRGVVEDAAYRISVTNAGPEIPSAAKSFERLSSDKPDHLGLGLCMARRTAQRYGGRLVFGSPSSGAEVSLILPLAGSGVHALDAV
jgi:signal transduction histidine kinase